VALGAIQYDIGDDPVAQQDEDHGADGFREK
jgi:hypothetical protein